MGIVNPVHVAFVAIVALIVLGPKRFPDLARSVGNGYREFREALNQATTNVTSDVLGQVTGSPTVPNATVVEEVSPVTAAVPTPTPQTANVTEPVNVVEAPVGAPAVPVSPPPAAAAPPAAPVPAAAPETEAPGAPPAAG